MKINCIPNFLNAHLVEQQIEYLGHIVSGSDISMEVNKIQAILAWLIPTCLKQLRGFFRAHKQL